MKSIIYYIGILLFMWGCNSNKKQKDDHNHDHEHGHEATHVHGENSDGNHDQDHNHDGHAHGEGEDIYISPEQAQLMGIETEPVYLRSFREVIKTSGQIVAAQGNEQTVVANISGVVSFTRKDASEGANVGRGESLFSISSRNLTDGDPVMRTRSAFDIAKREFDRAEKLIEDKLISQKEYNEIKLTYESAKIAHEAISGGGSKGGHVASPISGYIKSILVTEGQFVNVGDPLMVVTQNNKLQLRADVSLRFYKSLGSIVSANFKNPYEDTLYKLSDLDGRLLSYGTSLGDSNHYIPISFEFNNIGRNIVPGSFVDVYLLSRLREYVLSVPKSSLTDEQGLYFVYCKLTDEEYVRKEVQVGATDGQRVEVLGGLTTGEHVVTKGAYHVKLAKTSDAIPHSHAH